MSKFVGAIVGVALVAIGIVTGNPYLIVQGGLMIASNVVMLLTMPKTPARAASEMTIALGEQPRCLLVGETFTAGSLVDGFDYGGKYGTDWEVLVIRLADHKCAGLKGFFVNDEYVPYKRDGNYARFNGETYEHLHLYFRADTTNDPLPAVVLDNGPRWTAADIGASGCDVIVAYRADVPDSKNPIWPGGRPRFGFVVKGKLQWDPRLDSTVPGGSGPQRWDDPSTWAWTENAVVCRYNWVRGIYANDDNSDQTKLLIGRGLTAEEAPPENIFAAANECDVIAGISFPFETRETTLTLFNAAFSSDLIYMLLHNGAAFETWYLPTRSLVFSGNLPATVSGDRPGIARDGSIWFLSGFLGDTLNNLPANGSSSGALSYSVGFLGGTGVRVVGPDDVVFVPGPVSGYGYFDPSTAAVISVALAFAVHNFIYDGANIWLIGNSGSTLYFYCHSGPRASELQTLASPTGSTSALLGCNPGAGKFICVQGSNWFTVDDTTWTASTPVALGTSSPGNEFDMVQPGDTEVWVGWSEILFTGPALIRTVVSTDWTFPDFFRPVFDPFNHAIIADGGGSELMWRFLDRNGSWRVAGPVYANQSFIEVEEMFAAACAGSIITHEGSVELEPGQARSVVATFTDADLLSGSQVSWNQGILSDSSSEWVNTVVARYIEPDQKWNDHAAPVVRSTADIVTDGKPREASITLRLVRYRDQALRIAEIARRMGRIWGRASVKLGPRFCEIEAGDWVSWQSDRHFAGGSKICRVESYAIDEKWQITLTLREITAAAFAADGVFDIDRSQPITTRRPIPVGAPDSGAWTLAPTTLDSAGASVPALVVTGAATDDPAVQAIIVEYWKDDGVIDPIANPDAPPWIMAGRYAPGTTRIEITGLVGTATYYVAISYVVSGIVGDRLVLGPETITDLVITAAQPFGFAFGPKVPTASKIVGYFDSPIAWTLPTSLPDSQGDIVDSDTATAVAPSAQTDFDIQSPPGTSIGTMRFAASALTATFIKASSSSIPLGQSTVIIAPSNLNGIAGAVVGTIKGTR